jgi:hypothetical protein
MRAGICRHRWGKEVKSVSPKALMKIHVFWDMTPRHWVRAFYISEDCKVFSKSSSWKTKILLGSLKYEDERTMNLWNIGNYLPNNTVSYSKIWIVSKTAVGTSNLAKRWCLNFNSDRWKQLISLWRKQQSILTMILSYGDTYYLYVSVRMYSMTWDTPTCSWSAMGVTHGLFSILRTDLLLTKSRLPVKWNTTTHSKINSSGNRQ